MLRAGAVPDVAGNRCADGVQRGRLDGMRRDVFGRWVVKGSGGSSFLIFVMFLCANGVFEC